MWPTDVFLAFLLISAPIDEPVPLPDADDWPRLQFAVREMVLHLNIRTEKEANAALADRRNFPGAVKGLRRMWVFVHDAPAKEDLDRFPSLETLKPIHLAWEAHDRRLLRKIRSHPNQLFTILPDINETQRRAAAWGLLRRAREEGYVRVMLKHVKKNIGEEDYRAGRLPPLPREVIWPW